MLNYGNLNKMDKRQYYLQKIAEEALEVATAAMKCIQFGNDSRDPSEPDGLSNQEYLELELNDLMGAVFAARNCGLVCEGFDREAIRNKELKIDKYYDLCVKLGTVTE